jgi:hypothetical protein
MGRKHDPQKVLLGSTGSSDKLATCEVGDPSTFKAGLAVRRNTNGELSLTTGQLIGVSLGRSLSDTSKTSVLRSGNFVPVQLTDEGVFASLQVEELIFTAKEKGEAGNDITIALLDEVLAGAEEVIVEGTDIVVHMEDGESTAAQIKAALDASEEAMALIGVEITEGDEAVKQDAFSEANLADGEDSFPYAGLGAVVEVNATSGKAVSDGVATGAFYVSEAIKGVDPITKEEIDVALVDMGGGL